MGQEKHHNLEKNYPTTLQKNFVKEILLLYLVLHLGIDECAHSGAISKTIAVVAGGFNEILKGEKRILAQNILDHNGLILSEYEEDYPPLSYQFLERNRLISALSDAVIIVEAPIKSGAMNTANHAIKQGKKIFAVPWNLDYWKGEGCNNLLVEGASPILNHTQILAYLYASSKQLTLDDLMDLNINEISSTKKVPEEYVGYYEFIKENAPVSTQELITFFNNKSIPEITSDLSLMEIEGYIRQNEDLNYTIL